MVYGHNTESQLEIKLLLKCIPIFNFTNYDDFFLTLPFF